MKYICPDCGTQYETGKFCLECGAKLQEVAPELVCPSCGYKSKTGKFCPECGTRLEASEASTVATPKPQNKKYEDVRLESLSKYYGKDGFPRDIPQEEYDVAYEELKPLADQGVAEAQMLLGNLLMQYCDSESYLDECYSLLTKAESGGNKISYYILGMTKLQDPREGYYDLEEAEKRLLELNAEYEGEANAPLAELYAFDKIDYKKAFQYATAAAEEDEQGGYKILGDLYLGGWGVTKNAQKAFDNYKMAAAFGDAVAMNQIGWLFAGNDDQFKVDQEQAFYWYNKSAKKGNAVGMFNVGHCYQNGEGVKKDDEIAAEWFKKAAELGHVHAMNKLGDYYQDVLIDLDKAESWYREGADLGDAECQNKLGVLLDKNFDHEEANSWYQKAMEQNQPNAYNNYALNLWEGNGVEENKQKAIELKEKAIELGLTDGVNSLGVWYGLMGDDEKANECFLKAIDQENPWGYYNYAWSLWNGAATEINKDKAIEFMSKAAEMGLEEANDKLEQMRIPQPTLKINGIRGGYKNDSIDVEYSISNLDESILSKDLDVYTNIRVDLLLKKKYTEEPPFQKVRSIVFTDEYNADEHSFYGNIYIEKKHFESLRMDINNYLYVTAQLVYGEDGVAAGKEGNLISEDTREMVIKKEFTLLGKERLKLVSIK